MPATLTRTAKAKMLNKVTDLSNRINSCRHTESLGDGSSLSTLIMDQIRRENGRDAWTERQNLTAELREVAGALIEAGCKASTINNYSNCGHVVGMVGTDEFVELNNGQYREIETLQVTI